MYCDKAVTPKDIAFCICSRHPVKQKLLYSTVPTWDRTMDARFLQNFVFWALNNAHNWLQKVTHFLANMRPHEIWPYMVGWKLFESVMGDFWWGVVWGGSKYSRVVWGGRRWNLDGMGNNFVPATNVQWHQLVKTFQSSLSVKKLFFSQF